jgi:hypothetical protein
MSAQPNSRCLALFACPDTQAFEHSTILVVDANDVLSDQLNSLDFVE